MKTIADVLQYVSESNGEEFTVRFLKRGTLKPREMICKVDETLKHGERAYDPAEHHLVYVYEVNVGQRCFPLDSLKEIKIKNKWHTIVTPDVMHQQLLDDAMDRALSSE